MDQNLIETKNNQIQNFNQVSKVITNARAIVDSELLPLIDRAEGGDYHSMRKLWEIFVYGTRDTKPNRNLSERYWTALHDQSQLSCESRFIAQTQADYAFMISEFSEDQGEIISTVTDSVRFIINQVEPIDWDTPRLYKLQEILDSILNPIAEV
jgi:hypothetical protein